MRTFIALNLNKYALAAFTDTLKAYQPHLPASISRYILPENYHITLAFLGEIDRTILPVLSENLQTLTQNMEPFSICLRELKYFPHEEHPIVLAAIIDPTPTLMTLESNLVQMLKNMNLHSEHHDYRPHMSIAYCKDLNHQVPPLPKMLLNISSSIHAISVYESHTSESSARYEKILEMIF
jgi:2'-5' RNA ligase